MNPLSEFVYYNKYARWNPTLHRRATFDETSRAYVSQLQRIAPELPPSLYDEILRAVQERFLVGSMRLFAMAGRAFERDNLVGYNCAATPVDSFESLHDLVVLGMAGVGVTYSVEQQHICKLPTVAPLRSAAATVVIADTAEGWAQGYLDIIKLAYQGYDVRVDTSLLRPAGAVLKTKGGRASGPEPFEKATAAILKIITGAAQRKLTSLEISDICCHLFDSVVSGGMRRVAGMALFSEGDDLMINAKQGNWYPDNPQRSCANFSQVLTKTHYSRSWWHDALHTMFDGEPAFFNRAVAQTRISDLRISRLSAWEYENLMVNPCLAGDTLLIGSHSLRRIANGDDADYTAWSNGQKPTLILTTNAGHQLRLTPEHRLLTPGGDFVEAQNALDEQIVWGYGDAVAGNDSRWQLLGFLFGDGFLSGGKLGVSVKLNRDKECEIAALLERFGFHQEPSGSFYANRAQLTIDLGHNLDFLEHRVWERVVPEDILTAPYTQLGAFLSGLFEANGSINIAGQGSIKATCLPMVRQIQIALSAFGVQAWICTNKQARTEWPNGTYTSRVSYNLQIAGSNVWKLADYIGIISEYKRARVRRGKKPYTGKLVVTDIQPAAPIEVWDFKMQDGVTNSANGLIVHNCGETIIVKQLCNLSAPVWMPGLTPQLAQYYTSLAAVVGTIQARAVHFPSVLGDWSKRCRDESLLGVGIIGYMDAPRLQNQHVLQMLAETVDHTNREIADQLSMPVASATRAVKPAGNSGLLMNAGSGIHPWYAPFVLRRVTLDENDPVYKVLRDSGVPLEPHRSKPGIHYALFPQAAPKRAITAKDISAVEMLDHLLSVTKHYSDQAVSVTIPVKPGEESAIVEKVYRNQHGLVGCTFFRPAEWEQPPITEIDEREFLRRNAEFPEIKWDLLAKYEQDDMTTSSGEIACAGGSCELT